MIKSSEKIVINILSKLPLKKQKKELTFAMRYNAFKEGAVCKTQNYMLYFFLFNYY